MISVKMDERNNVYGHLVTAIHILCQLKQRRECHDCYSKRLSY